MSRKAFLIWGLVIISFHPIASAVTQFLGLSKIIPHDQSAEFIKQVAGYLSVAHLIIIPIAFGAALHFRFKEIGRRKRILALCMLLLMYSLTMPNTLVTLYNEHIIKDSGAMTRLYAAIAESSKQNPHQSVTPWTFKHAMDFTLIHLPAYFLGQIGLFALLWFGSLDPRTPSKSKIIQFLKTGFQKKSKNREAAQSMKLVTG